MLDTCLSIDDVWLAWIQNDKISLNIEKFPIIL